LSSAFPTLQCYYSSDGSSWSSDDIAHVAVFRFKEYGFGEQGGDRKSSSKMELEDFGIDDSAHFWIISNPWP
jgi:hypothetical protein